MFSYLPYFFDKIEVRVFHGYLTALGLEVSPIMLSISIIRCWSSTISGNKKEKFIYSKEVIDFCKVGEVN